MPLLVCRMSFSQVENNVPLLCIDICMVTMEGATSRE